MRQFTVDNAELTEGYGIRIGRWAQYAGLDRLPFDAMWCEVPANSASALDQHPEVELAIVVAGDATFTVEGRDVPAPTGTALLLDPGERHVIHARRDPVRILSIYWLPGSGEPEGTEVPHRAS